MQLSFHSFVEYGWRPFVDEWHGLAGWLRFVVYVCYAQLRAGGLFKDKRGFKVARETLQIRGKPNFNLILLPEQAASKLLLGESFIELKLILFQNAKVILAAKFECFYSRINK